MILQVAKLDPVSGTAGMDCGYPIDYSRSFLLSC